MDEFEQSDSGKETSDSHNTFYQNVIHHKERENALIQKVISVLYFLLSLF